MKKLILLFSITIFFSSGNTNPEYAKNLATAQKLFELHGEEDIDAQLALVSQDIESNTSMDKSETVGYDQYVAMLKGYHAAFDNINYTAENWLPGTNEDGQLDGSVRTYGVWTAKNPMNGNVIITNAYHSFEFNAKGQIHEMRDYFDASGAMAAAMKETALE